MKAKHPPPKPRCCEECAIERPVMLEMAGLPVAHDDKGRVTEFASGWWLCVPCWILVGERMKKDTTIEDAKANA